MKESFLGKVCPENRVIIENGVAVLPDRSNFAGSIAASATLLEKGVHHYGLSLCQTVAMNTETPAKIMGIKNKGRIQEGYDADLVIFDEKLKIKEGIKGRGPLIPSF